MEIAQKKFPSFVIVAFTSSEVWSSTNFLMDCYLSHSKPLQETKNFHHVEIVNNKIQRNFLPPDCPCPSSSANENKGKSKFSKPKCECGKCYQVRYEFQCEKGGKTIKVLPAMCKKMTLRSIF